MFAKIFTLARGKMNDAAEEVMDRNAVTILEQELRDGRAALAKAQTELSRIVGHKKLAQQKYDEAEQSFLKYQQSGKAAQEAGNTGLAARVAERLQVLDKEGADLRGQVDQYGALEAKLRASVSKTQERLDQVDREIKAVRATEAVQRAQSSVMAGATGAGASANSAMQSLERIKAKQIGRQAELDAADELQDAMSGGSLDKELASAGFLEGGGAGFGSGFGSAPALTSSGFGQKQLSALKDDGDPA